MKNIFRSLEKMMNDFNKKPRISEWDNIPIGPTHTEDEPEHGNPLPKGGIRFDENEDSIKNYPIDTNEIIRILERKSRTKDQTLYVSSQNFQYCSQEQFPYHS